MNCVRVFVWCMLFISGTGPLYLFIYLFICCSDCIGYLREGKTLCGCEILLSLTCQFQSITDLTWLPLFPIASKKSSMHSNDCGGWEVKVHQEREIHRRLSAQFGSNVMKHCKLITMFTMVTRVSLMKNISDIHLHLQKS